MSPDSAPPPPPAEPPATERGWVWHSTLVTKAAGKVSVLAVVETVLACIGYWWIAFRYDTHRHLLTSILIAPLLLLRSPESIKLGVGWFLSRPFENWETWSRGRRRAWTWFFAIAGGVAAYFVCMPLAQAWLPNASGWALFGRSAVLGLLVIWVGIAVAGSGSGTGSRAGAAPAPGAVAGAVAGAFAVAFAVAVGVAGGVAGAGGVAVAGAVAGAFAGAVAVDGAGAVALAVLVAFGVAFGVAFFVPGIGLGCLLRSLACRLGATVRHFWRGWSHLPANWQENNLLTDSTLPPELMPGVRDHSEVFALEGMLKNRETGNDAWLWHLFFPILAVIMFVPAILYRISIKATAWFWWPLAMLLKPVPAEDEASGERDRLTHPYRNLFKKDFERLTILIAIPTVLSAFLDEEKLMRSLQPSADKVEGVPFLLRMAQALSLEAVRPGHWAALIILVSNVVILRIAGRAVQHDDKEHWPAYQNAGLRRDLWCMDMLKRVRLLATLFFWGTGILALLLETKAIPEKIPLPARQTEALRKWFAGDSPVPKEDSQPR